jgi:hypothetical protein
VLCLPPQVCLLLRISTALCCSVVLSHLITKRFTFQYTVWSVILTPSIPSHFFLLIFTSSPSSFTLSFPFSSSPTCAAVFSSKQMCAAIAAQNSPRGIHRRRQALVRTDGQQPSPSSSFWKCHLVFCTPFILLYYPLWITTFPFSSSLLLIPIFPPPSLLHLFSFSLTFLYLSSSSSPIFLLSTSSFSCLLHFLRHHGQAAISVSGEGGGGEAQKEFTTVAAAVNAIKKKKMVMFSLFMFLFFQSSFFIT